MCTNVSKEQTAFIVMVEGGGIMLLRNDGKHVPDYMVS
jgi:hypothetical protein